MDDFLVTLEKQVWAIWLPVVASAALALGFALGTVTSGLLPILRRSDCQECGGHLLGSDAEELHRDRPSECPLRSGRVHQE